MNLHRWFAASVLLVSFLPASPAAGQESVLAGTRPLTMSGDIASELVDGVDRFLLGEIEKSVDRRPAFWNRDTSSPQKYNDSIEPNRQHLAHILGVRDARVAFDEPEFVATTRQPALVGRGTGFDVFAVRWPAFADVHGEGLLLVPTDGNWSADVVAVPDADQTPEMIAGLTPGVAPESQFARILAESGVRVLVPTLIDRQIEPVGQVMERITGITPQRAGFKLTHRELLYRSAYQLGRHLIGYELQKILAGVDWFAREAGESDSQIGVIGWGEGGMLALYAGALDTRIDAVLTSGYFDSRLDIWQEPIDRNVFGLLEEFGDAELAAMIAPRTLIVEAARGPAVEIPPGLGGAPGRLVTPRLQDVVREVDRSKQIIEGLDAAGTIRLIVNDAGTGPFGSAPALDAFLESLSPNTRLVTSGSPSRNLRNDFDPAARLRRQMHEIDRHNQWLLQQSPYVREQFLSKLDAGSLEQYQKTIETYRDFFHTEVVGRFEYERLAPDVRSRKAYAEDTNWTGYEVVMDVFPDVIAYGILLVPNDIRAGEKRPVVVCQHGLEGRPQDVVSGDHPAYHDFAARLAERGFVTFAPQNLYKFEDRFRTLQRKANPLGKTLFSIIVPQHQQIVDWMKTLPFVDGERIAFYGLSYGGSSAMYVPPLVTDYCLSICSACFNDWIWKTAATNTGGSYSYVWTKEYEMFAFNLGGTFNHSEMAALICPRPFMVERGHIDGVAPDERVAFEYAKVRRLYAQLGIPDRTEIEFFNGRHEINGQGTFDFLHRHLKWPKPERQ